MRAWSLADLPTPFQLVFIHASLLAAQSAAFAPMFGNDPSAMGPTGFAVGLLSALPPYALYVFWSAYTRRRR